MWKCLIPDLYTGTGQHTDCFLINEARPYHQNTIDHFVNAHAKVNQFMVDAVGRGEVAETAAAACLKMFREQKRKTGGDQMKLTALVRAKAEMTTTHSTPQ